MSASQNKAVSSSRKCAAPKKSSCLQVPCLRVLCFELQTCVLCWSPAGFPGFPVPQPGLSLPRKKEIGGQEGQRENSVFKLKKLQSSLEEPAL